jgi:alkylation response protein AidB-like acyl-CoA dehydrogenase
LRTSTPQGNRVDFAWTAAQKALWQETVEFATGLTRDVAAGDRDGEFPRTQWMQCAAFGIQGLGVPEQYGGRALDPESAAYAMEAFGYGCTDNGLVLALNAQMWTTQQSILDFGTSAQKAQWLPALASGERVAAYALTEAEAGSDAYALQMQAERVAGGYRLNGRKTFVTLAPLADVALVFARTEPSGGIWGISAFLVERDRPGYRASEAMAKMGLRTVPMGELFLHDCVVPADNLLGAEGQGAAIAGNSLEWERSCMLASLLGTIERLLEGSVVHARTRRQFGQPIGRFQSVSNRIADLKLGLEAARLLVYRVAWLKKHGRPAAMESALAKLQVTELFMAASLDAVLVQGARGYLSENEAERHVRDAIGSLIYGGTSDIQRSTIARLLGL